MKKTLFILSLFFLNFIAAQEFSAMTYNIRLDIASDGENAWSNRKEFLLSQIKFYAPDVLGTQEGLPNQIEYIKNELSDYQMIGNGREGGNKGEYSAIFYNTKTFKLIQEGTFWLSDTPEKVSKGWDAAYLRVCTYGLFKINKSGRKIWIVNTHLDNEGKTARENGINLIVKRINELNTKNYPIVLMGDFNSNPESELIVSLKTKMYDTREISETIPFGPEKTFNAFKFNMLPTERIDYIFVSDSKKIRVLKYAVPTDNLNMKYPSDHFPVYTKLKLE